MSGEASSAYCYCTYTFPVTALYLDFGESSLEYICPVSRLHKYMLLLPTYMSSESSVT